MDANAKIAESGGVREIPPEEMAEIVADLRALAAAADASPESYDVRALAARIDERLGPINGRFRMEVIGTQILHRPLRDSERPLAAVMHAIMDLLLSIQLGVAAADCGAKLRTLADALEATIEPGPGNGREPVGKTAGLILQKLRSLPEHEGMTTSALLAWLSKEHRIDMDDSTLRGHLGELKPYGLQNKARIGYYVR